MPFKMHKTIFFPEILFFKKYLRLSHLKFSDTLPEAHLFFIIGLITFIKGLLGMNHHHCNLYM